MTQPSHLPSPRIAVIVPIFRHSVLLGEAVESVLRQEADFEVHIVLVNDGCPHAETEAVCRDLALTDAGRITYLRKPNGGLSDARNHGIRHALATFPGVEALYMLDADNRLRPKSLARSMAALDADPEADWIYPNIDMFGLEFAGDYGGDYSLLVHTGMNICEAGSLIRRRVFEADVFFDTSFTFGFEDWDFFLGAASAGFRGRNLEDFGFQYRKRPESMLANSARDTEMILGTMRRKHAALMRPETLLRLEQAECPRFAIHLADRGEVLLAVDPLAEGARRVPADQFDEMFWRHRIAPTRFHLPPFVAVMGSETLQALTDASLLHWVLWKLESLSDRGDIASLSLEQGPPGRFGYAELEDAGAARRQAHVLMLRSAQLPDALPDINPGPRTAPDSPQDDLPDTPQGEMPDDPPESMALALRLPAGMIDADVIARNRTADAGLAALSDRLRSSPYRDAAEEIWDWRVGDIHIRPRAHEMVRAPFDGAPAYPRLRDGRRHVGLILPLVEFGGVEKVALNMARGLRRHGWVPHLIVVDATEGAISDEWLASFESVNFLADSAFELWDGKDNSYFGTAVPDWAMGRNHGPALGLMSWLDAVINCHGAAICGVLGQLRRFGVRTANSLHLHELSVFGRPLGNTYLGLAYEHAYDLFVPCSMRLGDWCHAMGVPAEKILPVPNAPSFPADPERLAREQVARAGRSPEAPLRVIFLGRLDRQKGIDKLSECVLDTRRRGMALDWRVAGKAVVGEDAPTLSQHMTELLEPPLAPGEELLEAFAWADVMVLLSNFEGLPLTILEAMRSGVVTIATDVGSVSEVVRHGENGLLVPLETAVRDCVLALDRLDSDRGLLRRLSERAHADMRGRDWESATAPLAARLDALADAAGRDECIRFPPERPGR